MNFSGLFEFPTILIVIGMVFLVAAVIVGIFAYRTPKKDNDDLDIEEKLDDVSLEETFEKVKEFTEKKKQEEKLEIESDKKIEEASIIEEEQEVEKEEDDFSNQEEFVEIKDDETEEELETL